jgi:hypothetical protein
MMQKPRTYLANPYTVGNPARTYFYDRDELLKEIAANVGAASPTRINYAIVGPRQIGKTSLVLKLADELRQHMPVVYITLQSHPERDEQSFYCALLQPVRDQLEKLQLTDLVPHWRTFEQDSSTSAAYRFDEDVEALSSAVLTTQAVPRIVFIIDEAELLQEFGGSRFLGFLRSIMQNMAGLAFIVAGAQLLSRMVQDYTSPFYNVFLSQSLGPLPHNDAVRLVREPVAEWGLTFHTSAVDHVLEQTGNHPHLIRMLCYEVCEYLRHRPQITEIDDTIVRQAAKRFVQDWKPDLEHGDYFSGMWDAVGIDAQARLIMIVLAWAQQPLRIVDIANEARDYLEGSGVTISIDDIGRVLDRLMTQLVVRQASSNSPIKRYLLTNDLLRDWIREHRDLARIIEMLRVPETRDAIVAPMDDPQALDQIIQRRQEQISFLQDRLKEEQPQNAEAYRSIEQALAIEREDLERDQARKRELDARHAPVPAIPQVDVSKLPADVQDEIRQLQRLIEAKQKRLQVREVQAATFGSHTSPEIVIEIDELRTEIAKDSDRLQRLMSTTVPTSAQTGVLDYDRGLQRLRQLLENTSDTRNALPEYFVLEQRLQENLSSERRYGSTESTRIERARVIDSLNRLALQYTGTSFNDFALGK